MRRRLIRGMPRVETAAARVESATRWYRGYVRAPRYATAERRTLYSADGTRLAAVRLPGPTRAAASVVLVHGFANSSRSPAVYRFARLLAADFEVLALDLRGHGGSAGRSTFGDREPDDVAAAVAATDRRLPVVLVGTSLGGASVLLAGANLRTAGEQPAGVVAISAPARWIYERPGSVRALRAVNARPGRLALAWLLRTRVDPSPRQVPDPVDRVGRITPGFTVIVHDPADHYFGPDHAEALFARAGEPRALWWRPGGGHGSDLLTPRLAAELTAEIELRLIRG